jgi:glutamate carboxypeptidase
MYILECADGSYYTGSTMDLEKRLWQHQNGFGANHTRRRLPVKLVYCEFCDRVDDAYKREKQIQGWSRKKKKALIEENWEKFIEFSKNFTQSNSVSGQLASTGSANVHPELVEGYDPLASTGSANARTFLQPADFESLREWMIGLLADIVAIESPTTDKAAVDRLGLQLAAEARSQGAQVQTHPRQESGDCLVCRWNSAANSTGLLILCHMDTVFPMGSLAQMPWRREQGKIFGPGTMDMKAGIVQTLAVIRKLRESGRMPKSPLTLLLTCDEETGSLYSRTLIETLARQAEAAFCMEPAMANGAIKTSRKGTGDITLEVRGVAAHAGVNHEKGHSAIEEMAHHILAAQALTDYTKGTTVNVGVVSGGTRPNVVPEHARAEIDFRVQNLNELDRLQAWVDGLRPVNPGTSLSARLELNRPPMPRDATMARSFEKARVLAAQIGLDLQETGTGGGSDANFVAPLGIPVLDGLGPIGDGAHSEREFFWEDSLLDRAALLAALIENF